MVKRVKVAEFWTLVFRRLAHEYLRPQGYVKTSYLLGGIETRYSAAYRRVGLSIKLYVMYGQRPGDWDEVCDDCGKLGCSIGCGRDSADPAIETVEEKELRQKDYQSRLGGGDFVKWLKAK